MRFARDSMTVYRLSAKSRCSGRPLTLCRVGIWAISSPRCVCEENSTVYADIFALKGGINIDQAVLFGVTVAARTISVDQAFLGVG